MSKDLHVNPGKACTHFCGKILLNFEALSFHLWYWTVISANEKGFKHYLKINLKLTEKVNFRYRIHENKLQITKCWTEIKRFFSVLWLSKKEARTGLAIKKPCSIFLIFLWYFCHSYGKHLPYSIIEMVLTNLFFFKPHVSWLKLFYRN